METQFESNSPFDMDDNSSIDSQPLPSPAIPTSFPFYMPACNSFSSTSSQSNVQDLSPIAFGTPNRVAAYWLDEASPASTFLLSPTESEPSHAPLPYSFSTRIKRENPNFGYGHISSTDMMHHTSPNSSAIFGHPGTSGYFPATYMGTPFMMPSTPSISGPEATGLASPWSCTDDSPNPFTPDKQLSDDSESVDSEQSPQSPLSAYSLHDSESICQMRSRCQATAQKIPEETPEIQQAHAKFSKEQPFELIPTEVIVNGRSRYTCGYSSCHKAFRRIEHLKRHKQTYHGEGPNKFSCEFCGKNQFNRFDNLRAHRRLHTRVISGNRAVKYIPAAVAVIEEEERTRKRRVSPKSKQAKGQGTKKSALAH